VIRLSTVKQSNNCAMPSPLIAASIIARPSLASGIAHATNPTIRFVDRRVVAPCAQDCAIDAVMQSSARLC
jgi:hypothetical protein